MKVQALRTMIISAREWPNDQRVSLSSLRVDFELLRFKRFRHIYLAGMRRGTRGGDFIGGRIIGGMSTMRSDVTILASLFPEPPAVPRVNLQQAAAVDPRVVPERRLPPAAVPATPEVRNRARRPPGLRISSCRMSRESIPR
jgi:hypothetical protein